jgi:hypothetical protein
MMMMMMMKYENDFIFDRRFWRVNFERQKGAFNIPITIFYLEN